MWCVWERYVLCRECSINMIVRAVHLPGRHHIYPVESIRNRSCWWVIYDITSVRNIYCFHIHSISVAVAISNFLFIYFYFILINFYFILLLFVTHILTFCQNILLQCMAGMRLRFWRWNCNTAGLGTRDHFWMCGLLLCASLIFICIQKPKIGLKSRRRKAFWFRRRN